MDDSNPSLRTYVTTQLATDGGHVVVGGTSRNYSNSDNTPVLGAMRDVILTVNGSIQLVGNTDGIIFGRGSASFLRDEELGFGWGGGWYMQDGSYIRARNDVNIYTGNAVYAGVFYDANDSNYYLNPNASTSLRTYGSWRASSGDWDGEFAGKIQYHVNSWYLQAQERWYFRNEGGENVLTADNVGNLILNGALTENSSLRYKENIQSVGSVLDSVETLRAVTYNKIGQDQTEFGLIAEEVAEVYPEIVNYDEAGRPDGINYTRLSAILLKAVQELSEKIKKLES